MRAMKNNLQEAVSILYDMETNIFYISESIYRLNNKINALGHKKTIRGVSKKSNDESVFEYFCMFLGVSAIIGAVLGAIYYFFATDGFFKKIGSMFIGAIVFAIYAGIAGAIAGIIYGFIKKTNRDDYIEKMYQNDLNDREIALKADERRVKAEQRQIVLLQKQKKVLENRLSTSNSLLRDFYETVGIDENYRHPIAIGYMYEFMKLGISTHLEGADGLYYLVRKELRMDQIQATLNDISSKLDVLLDTQSQLYCELKALQQKSDIMIQKVTQAAADSVRNSELLEGVLENTAITAYNTERISREAQFCNFMMLYGK